MAIAGIVDMRGKLEERARTPGGLGVRAPSLSTQSSEDRRS